MKFETTMHELEALYKSNEREKELRQVLEKKMDENIALKKEIDHL